MPLDIAPLMGADDRDFIEQAYGRILGRTPDQTGIRHYMAALAAGRSRITILGELRYSPEGRALGVPVPGLRTRFLLHRIYRLPGLGRLARCATGVLALPGLMRDVSALAAELHAFRNQVGQVTERETRGRIDHVQHMLEREQAERQTRAREMQQRLDQLAAKLDEEPWAAPLLALAERYEAHAARLDRIEATPPVPQPPPQAAVDPETELAEANAALEQRNLVRRALAAADTNRAALQDQERRLSLILAELRGWIAHGAPAGSAERAQEHQDHLLDPLYVAFEDRFRGSRADIKERQKVYLDLLRETRAGQPGRAIVDVGSGRGELLELFRDEGLAARGVDLNESMVQTCVAAGLDCTLDDAVSYLARLDENSLGAVTGFHIIEHLPFTSLVALLDASLRALAPGGVVIFETPNPANLLVSSRWFHLDPTHRNPLPAEMVSMIAEARGFVSVSIRELHPMDRRFESRDDVLATQLDAIFFGPQDYALIARKA